MLFNLITVVLATLALGVSTQQVCYLDTEYSLNMFLPTTNEVAPLHAIDNGAPGNVILVAAQDLKAPGTPVYESGAAPNTDLCLDVTDAEPLTSQTGNFHLSVMDMGEVRGAATSVISSKDFDWPHWTTDEFHVWPMLTSGAQMFFACNVNIGGKEYTSLSWGQTASDGSMPPGCYTTLVGKSYAQVRC